MARDDLSMDCPECGAPALTQYGVLGELMYAEWICPACSYWWVTGEALTTD